MACGKAQPGSNQDLLTCAGVMEEIRTELRAISDRSVIEKFHACLAVVYSSSCGCSDMWN